MKRLIYEKMEHLYRSKKPKYWIIDYSFLDGTLGQIVWDKLVPRVELRSRGERRWNLGTD